MGRAKEDFVERTGGLRLGENQADLRKRVAEIDKLERDILSPKLTMGEREQIQRRLCALKGVDFDSDDDLNE
jgi:hypothetical protein